MIPKLFHGTLAHHINDILENGITMGEGWGGAGTEGVFLSGTPEGALYWAKMAYQRANDGKLEAYSFDRDHGREADRLIAVVAVQIPKAHSKHLMADEEQFEDVGADFEPDDWRQSLEKIGDVRFNGMIPPEWLREVISPSEIERK